MHVSLSNVAVTYPADGPLDLMLTGHEAGTPARVTELAFCGALPPVDRRGLPSRLDYAEIDSADPPRETTHYRLRFGEGEAGEREIVIVARNAFVHRDVSIALCAAIPPRKAPWLRRVAWRALPAIVASRTGRRILLALRRR